MGEEPEVTQTKVDHFEELNNYLQCSARTVEFLKRADGTLTEALSCFTEDPLRLEEVKERIDDILNIFRGKTSPPNPPPPLSTEPGDEEDMREVPTRVGDETRELAGRAVKTSNGGMPPLPEGPGIIDVLHKAKKLRKRVSRKYGRPLPELFMEAVLRWPGRSAEDLCNLLVYHYPEVQVHPSGTGQHALLQLANEGLVLRYRNTDPVDKRIYYWPPRDIKDDYNGAVKIRPGEKLTPEQETKLLELRGRMDIPNHMEELR
jgi:hypothetical protein